MKLPRDTDDERAARSAAIRAAAVTAADVPLRTLEACRDVVVASEALAGRSNLNAASDLVVASRLAEAAAHGAAENVIVNLPSLGDEARADELRGRVATLLAEIEDLAESTRAFVELGELREPERNRGRNPHDGPEPASGEPAGPRLLRGGPIATDVRAAVAADVAAFREEHGYAPALAVVIVGRDAPSTVYLHKILDGCRTVGIEDRLVELGGCRPRTGGRGDRRPERGPGAWPGSSSRCRCRRRSRCGS